MNFTVDHFVITTQDLDKCVAFYEGILGMEHRVTGGQHAFYFGTEKINLHLRPAEFHPAAKAPGYGTQDFCLRTEGDIHEIRQRLVDAGVEIIEGVVERHGALGLMDSVYMYDPDGNLVEISVYR